MKWGIKAILEGILVLFELVFTALQEQRVTFQPPLITTVVRSANPL